MKKYKYKTAVYIGRMQPIHLAHLESIEQALKVAEKLIIVVGSINRPRTIKNPFSFVERTAIIQNAILDFFGESTINRWDDKKPTSATGTILDRITLIGVRDYMYSDYKWASEIYSKCLSKGATTTKDTVLMGCMKDDSSYYLKMFPSWDFIKIPYLYNLDATDIRNEWLENSIVMEHSHLIAKPTLELLNGSTSFSFYNDLKGEYDFLKSHNEMWKSAPYPVTFTTVDALVICSGCVLVVKRGTTLGKGQYALAGGYLNVNESIVDGALRELKEETKISLPTWILKEAIKDVKTFDHPKRSLRGRIITHVHLIDLGFRSLPDVQGNDDAEDALWLPMADVFNSEDKFFEDHYDIIVNMTSKY